MPVHSAPGLKATTELSRLLPHVVVFRALDGGYVDGVEVDVQMTVDSVAVLFHDASLESSSNCTGFTQNFSFEELNNCRYRQSTHNERIISLETILNRYKNHLTEFFLFLDIKLYDHQDQYYAARLIRSLGRLFRNYPTFAEKMIVQSGSSAFLTQVRHEISGAVLMLKTDNFNDGYIVCSELGLNGLVITHKKINRAQVKQAHGLNLYIVLTDISSRGDAVNALRNNPDFVQTDNVSLMQKILN